MPVPDDPFDNLRKGKIGDLVLGSARTFAIKKCVQRNEIPGLIFVRGWIEDMGCI